MAHASISAVLFDVDGTLIDTAPDFVFAVNKARSNRNKEPLAFELIRPAVSHGLAGLIQTCFGLSNTDYGYNGLFEELLELYSAHNGRYSQLFPGMQDVIQHLEGHAMPWGVVTNKMSRLAKSLMRAMSLAERTNCIVGGDTVSRAKPHPDPLIHACKLIDRKPEECLYVGDAERDIVAGRAAGMITAVALFGYIGEKDDPHSWGADILLHSPDDLLCWLQQGAGEVASS